MYGVGCKISHSNTLSYNVYSPIVEDYVNIDARPDPHPDIFEVRLRFSADTDKLPDIQRIMGEVQQSLGALTMDVVQTTIHNRPPDVSDKMHDMTPRRQNILALLSAGRTYKQIGSALHLSRATIKTHIEGITRAAGLERVDRFELAWLYARHKEFCGSCFEIPDEI